MRRIVLLFLIFVSFIFANVSNSKICGVFTNVLQTRKNPSAIDVKSGAVAYIHNSPGCVLNTGSVYNDGKHGIKCDNGKFATASGVYGKNINVNFNFSIENSHAQRNPAKNSSNNIIIKQKDIILIKDKYNIIQQDYNHYNFKWAPEGNEIGVNEFDNILNNLTISNINEKNLNIGTFSTGLYSHTNLIINGIPENIYIYNLKSSGSNTFKAELNASNKIDINTLEIARNDSEIVLKAPSITIENLNQSNSGSGNSVIKIYADTINIKNISLYQDAKLYIYPYTPGATIKFYSNKIVSSSSSTMYVSSGDYYTNMFSIPGTKNSSSIIALDSNQKINFYINGNFKPGNNPGINSLGNGGKFGNNPPANFRMYINGDLVGGNGSNNSGTTFNALIYVEGKTDLGTSTFLRGAISSYDTIKIGNNSQFYWDSSISNLPEAKQCILPINEFDNNYVCGIFKGPLITYDTIQGKGLFPKVCGSIYLYANKVNNLNTLKCSINPNCKNASECNIKKPPLNKYFPKFIESGQLNNIPNNLVFSLKDYKNYTFNKDNLILTFKPTIQYKDNSIKYSTFGAWTFDDNNVTLNFYPGDYYFDSLKFNGSNVKINVLNGGPVRIFVKENLQFYKNNVFINNGGDENNLFIYVGGNLEFKNTDNNPIHVYAFAYVKGNVEFKSESKDFYWYGAVTAEGDITIDSNYAHFIYRGITDKLGYENCSLCYAYYDKNNFLNFNFVIGNGSLKFPLTTAIINQLYPVEDLNVTQNEDLSNLNEEASCYSVVDKYGNIIDRPIKILVSKNNNNSLFGIATNLTNLAMSTASKITEQFTGKKCIGSVNAKVKVIANFGNYNNDGFKNFWALRTYMENLNFIKTSRINYYANYIKNGKKYTIKLDYCNLPKGKYKGIRGPFDAWDIFRNIKDRNISTKIVNKDFNLTLASLNSNDNMIQPKFIGDINVSIYDMINGNRISNIVKFNTNSTALVNKQFIVYKASKDARVGFLLCSNYVPSLKTHYLYSYSKCKGKIVNCNVAGLHFRRCYSSDNFAIRPYKFKIIPISNPIKSGKNFKLEIEALDYKSNPTTNYNESIKINASSSPVIEYNDTNISKGCITGKLNISNINFINGVANLDLNYSEVGEVNLSIKEVNGSEFAKVDEDDTSWKDREIQPDSTILKFIPDHFSINAIYKNFNNSSFTYLSNDLGMASKLDVNITAENADNKITKNYNYKCYAKNFDLNISYRNVPANINKILIKEQNSKEINISIPKVINTHFSRNYFSTDNNGTAKLYFYINLEKNYRQPVNEFNFTIKDINVSDGDAIGISNLNKIVTFKYGRIDVKDISGYGNELHTMFRYEYWDNNKGWIVNKEHNSSIYGDVNLSKSYYQDVNISLNNIKNGEENVTISTTHALPYSTKIHLAIPSWLWYHPLAKDYKDPSSTNLDCLTHPCFNVNFQKENSGWGGVGTNQPKYQANKRTAEINSSSKKININKNVLKKINW